MIEKSKIRRFNALLTKLHLQDEKPEFVFEASNGRTNSTLDLQDAEIDRLIAHLSEIEIQFKKDEVVKKAMDKERENNMRKKILHYCHLMRWYKEGSNSLDWDRINGFCKKFSHEHKPLQQHNLKELRVLVSQFEKVYQHFLSKI